MSLVVRTGIVHAQTTPAWVLLEDASGEETGSARMYSEDMCERV